MNAVSGHFTPDCSCAILQRRKVEMKKEVCYTKTNKKRRVTGETGMKYADPYTPGAGFMPGHIAGRKETLERAEK